MNYGLVQVGTAINKPDSIGMNQGNQSTRNFAELDTWYMCSIIRDSDSVKIYFNGTLSSTKSVGTAASVINYIPTRIGGRVDNTRFWIGDIDDIGIWNRALTECEITELYTGQDCNVGISELNSNQPKELIKIVNLLGQEVEYTPNTVLIYQYSDGTSEKVFTMED